MKKTHIYSTALFVACSLSTSVSQADWVSSGDDVHITSGNVGVGTSTPQKLLDVTKSMVEPTILVRNPGNSGGATYQMQDDLSGADWKFKATQFGGFKIRDQANRSDVIQVEQDSAPNSLYIATGGNVGIGTDSPMSTFAVNGKITTKEIEVTLVGWPDYVFANNYRLRPLAEVVSYIEANRHLPDVPSKEDVQKNGVNLGEMDAILLRKIEELTLYVVELKKENEQLSQRIAAIEN